LTAPELVKSLPADYGRGSGPAYLRGATTCPALLALLFKHEHAQLNTALLVTGVRVSGGRAQVLLGSRTAPASYAILRREGRAWRIAGMLSAPLP
jgi:hypothetical protein